MLTFRYMLWHFRVWILVLDTTFVLGKAINDCASYVLCNISHTWMESSQLLPTRNQLLFLSAFSTISRGKQKRGHLTRLKIISEHCAPTILVSNRRKIMRNLLQNGKMRVEEKTQFPFMWTLLTNNVLKEIIHSLYVLRFLPVVTALLCFCQKSFFRSFLSFMLVWVLDGCTNTNFWQINSAAYETSVFVHLVFPSLGLFLLNCHQLVGMFCSMIVFSQKY